jgi:excisionase family DNA binding protein
MGESQLLTPQQVANRLQISRWTVLSHLRSGRMRGTKAGRLWRIPLEEVQAFLERSASRVSDAEAAINEALEGEGARD